CQPCHEDEHDRKDIRTELMARLAVDGPMSLDDFMAYGSGAMPDWMADDVLKALFEQVRSIKPQQFAGGRFLRNLDVFGIGREGYELMADLLDDPSSQFFGDLLDVMRKHGVKLLGDAKGDGVA
ncbi:hypothetical protein, partial [Methylibium sp. T29]|uniref:hypothetical protein n=1 Tax=Methylibium sp. T29 TaxID=1430884 RepID=UPI00055EE726